MSAIQYARVVRCDYPGCESVADVAPEEIPAGWLMLWPSQVTNGPWTMEIRDPWGMTLKDFCTLHCSVPLDQLAAAMAQHLTDRQSRG
jgi:hypothetical protein